MSGESKAKQGKLDPDLERADCSLSEPGLISVQKEETLLDLSWIVAWSELCSRNTTLTEVCGGGFKW